MIRPCALIPVYDHEGQLAWLTAALRAQALHCFLIDDGSHAACAATIDRLVAAQPDQVTLLRFPVNRGKGAAVVAGLREAARRGFSHALQIDADGQHDPADATRFIELAARHPDALICGEPRFDASAPRARRYGRYLTHLWVWINTLSFAIHDSMCGFRCYPLATTVPLLETVALGERMEFDSEIVVRLSWRGVPMLNLATAVRYPVDGVSHFDMIRDNARISRMHATLFVGMLLRLPLLLWRRHAPR